MILDSVSYRAWNSATYTIIMVSYDWHYECILSKLLAFYQLIVHLYQFFRMLCTGCPICIWTTLWGCLEVTGWLKIKKFNSSKKFMQIPLKVNKNIFCDINHGLTMTSDFQKIKLWNYVFARYTWYLFCWP